ncbi:hypothetical protein SAMN05660413_01134 [Salegentibacter flavus]|uniref:Uncharacterized protein n=1 Tax=Salegentibacter flavus TaxID=287099 RepID=A0A1I4Z780_9FLAO|nr:hypothetical protein SAMN05660413_01134 [Salegentibacter flavus]
MQKKIDSLNFSLGPKFETAALLLVPLPPKNAKTLFLNEKRSEI